MPKVAQKALPYPPSPDGYYYFDQIVLDGGSAPPRPTPLPPGGGGSPIDPGYSPPWAQIPVDPGYGIPELPPVPEVPEGKLVYLFPAPSNETPPAAPSADAEVVKAKYSDGGTGWVWADPHVAPGPSKKK